MSFFNQTSLFSSQIGQLIETATDGNSQDENLELFFEICDLINTKEEHAKEAIKVIRKKLSLYAGRDWSTAMKLLKLLEICSVNCNKKFQVQLASKDFLQELKNIVGPKLQPPLPIQEKVLYLIQLWAQTFKNDSDFKPIEAFYTELRTKGIDFPISDQQSVYSAKENKSEKSMPPELRASILNSEQPGASTSLDRQDSKQPSSPKQQFAQNPVQAIPGSAVRLNEEQMAKLQSEFDVVDNNVLVMNELLTEIQTMDKMNLQSNEAKKDIVLLKEINRTCQEMQKRITQLIGNISNESIIGDLLRINDDLNNSFGRYERFEKSFNNNNNNTDNVKPKDVKPKVEEKPLIDFNDDMPNIDSKSAAGPLQKTKKTEMPDDDDDSDINQFLQDENEIKEMENWLKTQGGTLPLSETKTEKEGHQLK